jgi:hypothetical protein
MAFPPDASGDPYEYVCEHPGQTWGSPRVLIGITAHGGGTVGVAYAHNGWSYAVTRDGVLIAEGDDLQSGGMGATHDEMSRVLADFLELS